MAAAPRRDLCHDTGTRAQLTRTSVAPKPSSPPARKEGLDWLNLSIPKLPLAPFAPKSHGSESYGDHFLLCEQETAPGVCPQKPGCRVPPLLRIPQSNRASHAMLSVARWGAHSEVRVALMAFGPCMFPPLPCPLLSC